ncbi:MAG: hypothetical protein Kow0019_12480 [Methanobacteriaceae archaeon]
MMVNDKRTVIIEIKAKFRIENRKMNMALNIPSSYSSQQIKLVNNPAKNIRIDKKMKTIV